MCFFVGQGKGWSRQSSRKSIIWRHLDGRISKMGKQNKDENPPTPVCYISVYFIHGSGKIIIWERLSLSKSQENDKKRSDDLRKEGKLRSKLYYVIRKSQEKNYPRLIVTGRLTQRASSSVIRSIPVFSLSSNSNNTSNM